MQGFLRKLLNLQPGEGRKLAVLYVLGFIIATSLVWGSAIGRGLFLKGVGIEWLPLMFVFDGLLALPVTVVYTAVVDRVSNAKLMAVIFGGVGVILLAGWGLLLFDSWGVTIPYITLVYALFYLSERVLRALFAIHAWTLFNDYLDIRESKRLFPILGSTSRVAGILAGSLVAVMASFLPAQNLVLAWVAVLGVGVWLSLRTPRWLEADYQATPARPKADEKSPVAIYWNNLRGGFRFVSASTFLKLLAVGAFAMTALLVLMDYQAQLVFNEVYATAEDLVSFYGVLETVINLIALPVQMFLLSRLVSWMGVAQVNLFYPVGSLIIYLALSIWPSLGTAMAGQFGKDTFRSSVQVPVDNMLYNAIPLPVKGRSRAFIKGLLLPIATVIIGLVLLPVRSAGALPYWVLGIGLAAAVVQLLVALLVRRQYTKALLTMLEEEDFSAYRMAGSELGPPDPATFRRLLRRVRTSDDPDFTVFLARIVAEVGGRDAGLQLVKIAETLDPQIQAVILEILLETETAEESALDLSQRSLTAEEPRLRRAALAVLERLMGADNPDLWFLAASLLDDPDPATRSRAVLLLVQCGDFFYLADAVSALNRMLDDEERSAHRAAGLRVLQAMGDGRMVRNLAQYLRDPDDGVRLQAAQTIESLADPQAPEWAVSLAREAVAQELADPAEGVRLSGLRALGKLGGEDALKRLIERLADPSDLVREQAGLGLVSMGQAAVPALEEKLNDKEAGEQERQATAVVLGQMARERIVSSGDAQRFTHQIEALFEDTLRSIYADEALIAALADLKPAGRSTRRRAPAGLDALLGGGGKRKPAKTPATGETLSAGEMLRDGLRQRNERRMRVGFRLLSASLSEPPSTIAVIARALQDQHSMGQARAGALEALESLTSQRTTRQVGQLTESDGGDVEKNLALGQQEWDLESLNPIQALERVLNDPDRWLAAIGVTLVGQGKLLEAQAVQDTWLPLWLADPDPAVQEAARYTTRRLDAFDELSTSLETEMVDTAQTMELEVMRPDSALSEVEEAIFLKQVPFFGDMTVDQLRALAGIAEEQWFDEGETIFVEGDACEALYVVVGGRIGIERHPKKGRVQRLETLKARQYFGERNIFDGAPHENRAVALDRVHLLTIRREPLMVLVRRSPDLSLSLVTVLSQRLREADSKLAARTRTKPDQVMRLYDKLAEDE